MQNGIPDNFTSLPEPVIDRQEVEEEQRSIKFLKSKEWDIIKKHWLDRMEFYQTWLPNGDGVSLNNGLTLEELGKRWVIADVIVAEIKSFVGSFEIKGE